MVHCPNGMLCSCLKKRRGEALCIVMERSPGYIVKWGKLRVQRVYMEGYYLCKISKLYLYLPTITRKTAGINYHGRCLPSTPTNGYRYRRYRVYFITLRSLAVIMSINQLGIPNIL